MLALCRRHLSTRFWDERGRQLRRPYENRPIAKRASGDGPSRVDVANLKYRAIDRYLNLSVGESFQGTGRRGLVQKAI
jgi:hypothetical protein